MARRPPEKLDEWHIMGKIDHGGQGNVYEARRSEAEEIRAIKLIESSYPKKRARFIQEVRKHLILSEKKINNIMPIIDHNLDKFEEGYKIGYIVMPRAATTLEAQKDLLNMRVELCLDIYEGIVVGVIQAHDIGVIHRDLKPANILFLDSSLRKPLISDFGICFVKGTPNDERVTDVSETVGAKFFMAPEQERGGRIDVQASADIYSLGKLLHYMLTGRSLYRENLQEAFQADELLREPRLNVIFKEILTPTIVEQQDQRLSTATELLEIIKIVKKKTISGQLEKVNRSDIRENESTTQPQLQTVNMRHEYLRLAKYLENKQSNSLKIYIDRCRSEFVSYWQVLYQEIIKEPQKAPEVSKILIEGQPRLTAFSFSIARFDANFMIMDYKRLLEYITRATEEQAGYIAINAIPYVLAGYHYMHTSVIALLCESWKVLRAMLNDKFEWYYQSGRPNYSLGFSHPYFFHSEALRRNATTVHDLYREEINNPEILEILGLKKEQMLNYYLQAQMLMTLRCMQEREKGNDIRIWPDFGRFYDYRVIPLIDRAAEDSEYASRIAELFEESAEEWFSKLNSRITGAISFMKGGGFFWESITSYEPRQ